MQNMMKSNSRPDSQHNKATRIITATIGILFAIAGFEHGLFEALQGNTPTNGEYWRNGVLETRHYSNTPILQH